MQILFFIAEDSKTFSNRFTPEDQGKKIKEIRCANPGKFIYFKRYEILFSKKFRVF